MNRDEFWALIQAARDGSADNEQFLSHARNRLLVLAPQELVSFQEHFDQLREEAYRWDLWAAAYIIGGGCSDDAFGDFRSWLVSMGRVTYEAALADPGALVAVDLERPEEDAFLESAHYLALGIYQRQTGAAFPGSRSSAAEPAGEPWEEEGVEALFPELAAKFAPAGSTAVPAPAAAAEPAKRRWWCFWR